MASIENTTSIKNKSNSTEYKKDMDLDLITSWKPIEFLNELLKWIDLKNYSKKEVISIGQEYLICHQNTNYDQ